MDLNIFSTTISRYKDGATSQTYRARVAFQVRIKPGSYDVGDQTIGATANLDPKFSNTQLEWSTKRRGVTVFTGLLVQVEGFGTTDGGHAFTQQQ